MDRLNTLEIFRKIVDSGSITKTAEALGNSKAMISKSLAILEERLGAKLIERTTRSMAPTELGQLVYRQSEHVLENYAKLEASIHEQQGMANGLLRVSAPMSFPLKPLSALVKDLSLKEPNLRIELVRSDTFVNLIDEGFDVALRMANLTDSRLIAKKLASLRSGFFASPNYLAEYGTPLQPDELDEHNCVLDSNLRPQLHFNVKINGRMKARPINGKVTVSGVAAAKEMAIQGMGIMAAPFIAVHQSLSAGDLIPVLENFSPDPIGLYIIYPGKQYLPLKTRRFIDLAAKHLTAFVKRESSPTS